MIPLIPSRMMLQPMATEVEIKGFQVNQQTVSNTLRHVILLIMPRKAKKSKRNKSDPSPAVTRPDLCEEGMVVSNDNDGEALQVGKKLKPDTSMTILDLRSSGIDDSVVIAHATALGTYKSLSKLFLSCKKVGDVGMTVLAEALKHTPTLREIHFSLGMDSIGVAGWESFSAALATNTSVESLYMHQSLSDDGSVLLFEALKSNMTLTKLDLKRNNVGQKGAAMLSEALECNTSLTTLDLSHNDIRDEGYAALLRVLKECNISLKNIELDSNRRDSAMIETIRKFASGNRSRTRLVHAQGELVLVGKWFCGDLAVLSEDLATNTTVTILDLEESDVYDEGTVLICEALGKKNRTLVEIGLGHNSIFDSGASALAAALRENSTLQGLDLTNNYITDGGVAILADSLKINKSLARLSLRRNRFGNDGAVAMADALASNTSLVKLNLCVNSIDDVGGTTILRALQKHNDTLLELDLILNSDISTDLQEVIDGMLASRRVLRCLLNHLHKPLEERVIPYSMRALNQYNCYRTHWDLNYDRKAGLLYHLAFREHYPKAAGVAGFIYHVMRTAANKKSPRNRVAIVPQGH
jgi:Ran GTPase-activating protein (RanGAP) involved in mRNA processing and transport